MKKRLALLLATSLLLSCASCQKTTEKSEMGSSDPSASSASDPTTDTTSAVTDPTSDTAAESTQETITCKYQQYASMTPEEIVSEMTLEEKAAQMVQSILYMSEEGAMNEYCYGSIVMDDNMLTVSQWTETVDGFQKAAIESESGIPLLLAQDNVHGVGYCVNSVYFPHNIGIGAANDEDLAYQMGLITADETKKCHMLWNLSPCVAQSNDPRWGRNYECYSSDLDTITRLSTAFLKGLVDGGTVACAKHFFGDGNVVYGTGENSDYARIIDRGDAQLTQEEIDALLAVYQAQIDAGVQTIMVSYSSLNGLKMHENGEYIWKLKNEMGFTGFIVSDMMALESTSPESYEEQVISAVNCGIDMLMEGQRYEEARMIIIDAVNRGDITMERIDEAVTRIIKVKMEAGCFDDPMFENLTIEQEEIGSMDYRAVAEQLVEKSLVLLKNENQTLPLKEGTKVYITGPAADDCRAQCGGWTMGWEGSPTKDIAGVTTILEAFERYAEDYGIEVITDPEKAQEADVVLLCVGEKAYAEWYGDTEDMELCGTLGLSGNRESIDEAKALGKPTVTLIVAGRQVILDKSDYENWDSVVMCYLPGSEGKGISDVLCGCSDFSGKLPEPWYGSVEQILTEEVLFERGYGLTYGDGFAAKTEPEAIADPPTKSEFNAAAEGTAFVRGVFENDVYTSEYAGITINVKDNTVAAPDSYIIKDFEDSTTPEGDPAIDEVWIPFWSSVIWDNELMPDDGAILIYFVNTKMAMPANPDCTEEELLDHFRAVMEYESDEERVTVTLGGSDYVRDAETYTIDGIGEFHNSYYVRRIDEDLMCLIEVQAWGSKAEDPYYFESWVA